MVTMSRRGVQPPASCADFIGENNQQPERGQTMNIKLSDKGTEAVKLMAEWHELMA